MYYFQESDPDSLPPPVSFSPPKAPPISAPEGPILTLTIPQSDPFAPTHLSVFYKFYVNNDELNPYGTELFIMIPSSKLLHLSIYTIGTNNSSFTIGAFQSISTIVGYTKFPFILGTLLPPYNIFPPYF